MTIIKDSILNPFIALFLYSISFHSIFVNNIKKINQIIRNREHKLNLKKC